MSTTKGFGLPLDTGANIGLRRVLPGGERWRYPVFFEIVQAGGGLVRRSRVSMMRPSGAGKDTTPAAFLLACASGAEDSVTTEEQCCC